MKGGRGQKRRNREDEGAGTQRWSIKRNKEMTRRGKVDQDEKRKQGRRREEANE